MSTTAAAVVAAVALLAAGLVSASSLYHRYLGADRTTFYLSADGADDAGGHRPGQAWRTLERLQQAVDAGQVTPGSRVRFERGGVFAGSLRLDADHSGAAGAPITLEAYGDAVESAPLLDAAEDLSGWAAAGPGQWTATCTTCDERTPLVLVDGRPAPLARWPNATDGDGYRYFTAQQGDGVVIDDGLASSSPTPSWVGAELVVRSVPWVLDRLPVAAQDGNRLTLSEPASYPLYVGFGYFLQNHRAALDQPGEWVWDAATRSITIAAGSEPGPASVEAVAAPAVLDLTGAHDTEVAGLALRGGRTVLAAPGCASLSLHDLAVADAADIGIDLGGCVDATLAGVAITDSADIGLNAHPCVDCSLTGSSITAIALLAGMGGGGDGHYLGARIGGADLVFEGNTIDGVGYLGVDVRDRAEVRGNTIRRFNQVKSDGGGIYAYHASDVVIADNLVADAPGSTAGTPWDSAGTHGIYIDDQSQRVAVTGNTVLNVGSAGIYLHNAAQVTVTGNTIVGPGEEGITLADDDLGDVVVSGLDVRDNTVVVDGRRALALSATTIANPPNPAYVAGLGAIDGNRYCGVLAEPRFRAQQPGTETVGLLSDWRQLSGYDQGSSCAAPVRAPFTVGAEAGPELVANGRFDTGIDGWFGWPDGVLQASWDPGGADGSPALQVGNGGGPVAHIDTSLGPVRSGTTYRIRFTVRDGSSGPVRVYLRQLAEPYTELADDAVVPLGPGTAAHEIYLTADQDDGAGLLIFELEGAGASTRLDDISVVAVTGTPVTLADAVRVETNPSATARTVTVTSDAIDAAGTAYRAGQQVELAPRTSLVLFS